ncbi:unnamed protein product (macronuclear) [Paramecium tetraurelia]|uniref:DH domain-containing protein n=1 Tax=Paramecium tetraurelia TaxID=5888 RepID=A0CIG3_PARTE|nr:uncharacterized protein GSPATT00007715001 [Paramecium tetraurelia]CAK70580.1 unnamed protein product [Paramecium tetraurelia]|eukprot:XP_001437977.1 hypothetical protein (macronuclear) [Paramecium tetraurelia strain d4-2]
MNCRFDQEIDTIQQNPINPSNSHSSKQKNYLCNLLNIQQPINKEQDKYSDNIKIQQKSNQSINDVHNRHSFKPRMSTTPNLEEVERIDRISNQFQQTMAKLEEAQELNSTHNQDAYLQKVVIVQSKIRSFLMRRQYLNLKTQFQYRKRVLNELFITEQSYCQALTILINAYLKPLREQNKLISSQVIQQIFSNVEAIQQLSVDILEIFRKKQEQFTYYSLVADIQLQQHISFFKIYSTYLVNYQKAFSVQMKLKKENKPYKQFLDAIDKQNQGKTLESYFLILPVQRIPKYVLLFKDLLKNTPQDHPDYANIKLVLDKFEQVANQNNKSMDSLLKNQKLFDLQKQYGNFVKILEQNRQFLREESLHMYFTKGAQIKPVIVYFLSDLILVTERDQTKQEHNFKTYIKLNYQSKCQQLPEMYKYKYLFQINGVDNSVIFVVLSQNSQQDMQEYINLVNQEIKELQDKKAEREKALQDMIPEKQKVNQIDNVSVSIQIIGTEDVIDATNNKFTQYIFEIDINNNITQKIYLRYSLFKKIQQEVKTLFPKIKISEIKENSYFDRNEAAVIDRRKILMIEFLQILLNASEFKENKTQNQLILALLGLPENFYDLPAILVKQYRQSIMGVGINFRASKKPASGTVDFSQNSVSFSSNENSNFTTMITQISSPREAHKQIEIQSSALKFSDQKTEQTTGQVAKDPQTPVRGLRAASMKNLRKISATQLLAVESKGNSRQNSVVDKEFLNSIQVKIKVMIFLSFKQVEKEFFINKDTSAFNLMEEIATEIQLQSAYDFRLYYIDNTYLKPLDNDERLWNFLVRFDEPFGLFKKSQKVPLYNGKLLQLRKHLYVSNKEETDYYTQDLVRLQLISYQLFDDISNLRLTLGPKDHILYTAFYLYINGHKTIDPKKIPLNEIKKFLPPIAIKIITQDEWSNFLPTLVQNFHSQIINEKQNQKQQMKSEYNLRNNQNEMTETHFALLVFLNLLKSKKFFGVAKFSVKPEKDNINKIMELSTNYWNKKKLQDKSLQNYNTENIKGVSSLCLGVGYNSLIVLSSFISSFELIEIGFDEIESISSLQTTLSIYLEEATKQSSNQKSNQNNKEKLCLKFETEKSYQIKQLVDEYFKLQMENQQQTDEYI